MAQLTKADTSVVTCAEAQALSKLKNSEIEHLIDEWVHSERDRKILKRRFIDGICFEPLAEEFDLSVRQVKSIVYKSGQKVLLKIK